MTRFLLLVFWLCPLAAGAADLPSWNDGGTKTAILEFVERVTKLEGPELVKPEDRVAVFDFDGTLMVEQPTYGQMAFCAQQVEPLTDPPEVRALFKRLRAMSDEAELNGLSSGDTRKLWGYGFAAESAGDIQDRAYGWYTRSWHPRYQRARAELLYMPMLELLRFLQAKGFKVFIVTGSVADLVRSIAEPLVGVPKENVIGSATKRRFAPGHPSEVERLPAFADMVDGETKVLEIDRRIGRRPIMAFGNSDGDLAMLDYATSGPLPGFAALVHHDDPEREYAYDREGPVGRLKEGLELAPKRGWRLISVKSDWKTLFP